LVFFEPRALISKFPEGILYNQPGLSWRANTLRKMALAGTPARYNKVFVIIRQYGPTFATAHGGIQYDCGGGFPTLPNIYLFSLFTINAGMVVMWMLDVWRRWVLWSRASTSCLKEIYASGSNLSRTTQKNCKERPEWLHTNTEFLIAFKNMTLNIL
jgi:hypothetical protein